MESEAAKPADSGWRETVKIVVHALVLAFIIRIFFYQPFNIPSGSMKDTLLVGEAIFAGLGPVISHMRTVMDEARAGVRAGK